MELRASHILTALALGVEAAGRRQANAVSSVISAATIEALNEGFEVIGIRDGFRHLLRSRGDAVIETLQ